MKWLLVESDEEQIRIAREINALVAEIVNQPIGTPVKLSKDIINLLVEIVVLNKNWVKKEINLS